MSDTDQDARPQKTVWEWTKDIGGSLFGLGIVGGLGYLWITAEKLDVVYNDAASIGWAKEDANEKRVKALEGLVEQWCNVNDGVISVSVDVGGANPPSVRAICPNGSVVDITLNHGTTVLHP